jgi:hypothetical protein
MGTGAATSVAWNTNLAGGRGAEFLEFVCRVEGDVTAAAFEFPVDEAFGMADAAEEAGTGGGVSGAVVEAPFLPLLVAEAVSAGDAGDGEIQVAQRVLVAEVGAEDIKFVHEVGDGSVGVDGGTLRDGVGQQGFTGSAGNRLEGDSDAEGVPGIRHLIVFFLTMCVGADVAAFNQVAKEDFGVRCG